MAMNVSGFIPIAFSGISYVRAARRNNNAPFGKALPVTQG
jgi:hypothetical protein